MHIWYRPRQFWHTFSQKNDPQALEQARGYLTPEERQLFDQLQASEKYHALMMLTKLLDRGEHDPDLLVAALLHDAGKSLYPLNPFERAIIVVGRAIFPRQTARWGRLPTGGWNNLPGWRKAFIVAEHHAAWGAEMARNAGASSLTVELIREHQHVPDPDSENKNHQLKHMLWLVDNES